MPTNYTADGTATQAPAPAPVARQPAVIHLPNDGESANVASIYQELKALADYSNFEQAPFGNSADLNQIMKSYRNAQLQTRSVIDHIGYRTGSTIEIDEDWLDVGKVLKNSIANGAWSGRWNYSLSGPFAGRVEVVGPGDNSFASGFYYPRTTCLKLSTSGGGITPNSASIEMPFGPAIFDDDGDVTMEWSFMSHAANIAMGLTFVTQQGVATEFVAQDVQGMALAIMNAHANFQLYTKGGTGSSHLDDSGVAKDSDAPHHARIEIRGANAADGAAAIVRLFLDGTHLVDRTILLGAPAGGSTTNLLPFFKITETNAVDHLWIGRLRINGNTELGDVVY